MGERISVSSIKKPLVIGFSVFFLIASLTQYLAYQRYFIVKDEKQTQVLREINSVKDRLQATLSYGFSATKTLGFIVEEYGTPRKFDSIAKHLLESNKYIDALELTKAGVISNIYPLQGNEKALGYNILEDSLRNKEAFKAIEKKTLFFAGPLELKQGGTAVIGRLPIFIDGNFAGFSVVIIKLSTLLKAAGIDTLQNNDFIYQLSKINPSTSKEEFFLPHGIPFDAKQSASIEIPDGEWKLYVMAKSNNAFLSVIAFSILGFIFSLTGGVFGWYLARQPDKLNKQVKEKTIELLTTQNNYRITIERVSDAFVALDKNWCYTYMNKKAGEIFHCDPLQIIGKHIWTEFPEGVGQPFYKAYYKAMDEQQYSLIEASYPPYDLWFENHIYPSSDGLTIYFKDVTERKRAQRKLESSEKYFRSLIENSSEAIVLIDNTGKVLYQSPSTERISGYSLEEMQALGGLEFIHPDDREKNASTFSLLVRSYGSSLTKSHRLRRKDGSYVWIEGTYTNLLKDENVNAIVYNYHDVTERIEAEQKLSESESRYRQLIQYLPEAIYNCDNEGRILLYNQAAVDLWGRKPELEKDLWCGSWKLFKKDGQPLPLEDCPMAICIREKRPVEGEEIIIERPDGTQRYVLVHPAPIYNNANEVIGSVNILIDITERKKAEDLVQVSQARLIEAQAVAKIGSWETNLLNLQVTWSLETYKIFEIDPDDFLHSHPNFLEYVHPLDKEKVDTAFKNSFNLRSPHIIEHRIITPLGTLKHVEERWAIFYDQDGKPIRALGTCQDITEKVKAEIDLKISYDQLKELTGHLQRIREEERTRIAREIHDELGQQLTGLKMDTSWILKNKGQNDMLIQEKLSNMISLIDQTIKTVRRISSELRPGILDDLGLIAALEWQSKEFEKRTGIKSRFHTDLNDLDLETNIETNIFRVYQEALTNVARHSEATLVETVLEERNGFLRLTIKDNGIGFDEEAVKSKKSLGLIGMRERASLFHGKLTFKIEKQNGVVIMLEMPFIHKDKRQP